MVEWCTTFLSNIKLLDLLSRPSEKSDCFNHIQRFDFLMHLSMKTQNVYDSCTAVCIIRMFMRCLQKYESPVIIYTPVLAEITILLYQCR